ncbi:MAG: toll/interleukin-1 receptor domain-containing protein [Anaerolineales bacterium]|nr:toll/interleukin-1 receptor domain-containing protein [Anaerolineales bacterium]
MKSNRLALLLTVVVLMLTACGVDAPATVFDPTEEAPATETPAAGLTPGATPGPEPLSVEEQLALVDDILKKSAQASIAYNAPAEMHVDETVTIELLLNPNVSEDELKKQISEPGPVHTSGEVEITPLMKARLVPRDKSAFSVAALPDEEHAIQVISGNETTKWSWNVTARKPGTQRLTLSLSRLVKYENEEYWREVGEYEADIVVQVTLLSQLKASGWKWIAGILIILVATFILGRRGVQRGRGPEQASTKRARPDRENLGRIFISYRRSDSADIAGRIYDRLIEEFGRDPIFKDVDSIPLGIDFREHLDRKVRECSVLLALIGDHWLDASDETGKKRLEDPADFVRIEIESALESGIPVIPLLVREAKMPMEKNLPSSLRRLVYKNGVQIRPDPDFHRDMDRLISALKKYVE